MSFLSSCFPSSQPISLDEDPASDYAFLPAPSSTSAKAQPTFKQPSSRPPPSYNDAFDAASLETISSTMREAIDAASDGLRKVSLSIHGKPVSSFDLSALLSLAALVRPIFDPPNPLLSFDIAGASLQGVPRFEDHRQVSSLAWFRGNSGSLRSRDGVRGHLRRQKERRGGKDRRIPV